MRNLICLTLTITTLSACNVEKMQQRVYEGQRPFVVSANEASVTIAAEGNYMYRPQPSSDPRTIPLAESTCKQLGKTNAIYQSSTDSKEHLNKRKHLFLCIN